jgi:hypothetical protein
MIVWISSYPRSGNTLLRSILNESFEAKSYSKYNDVNDLGSNAELTARVGHQNYGGSWEDAAQKFRTSAKPIFVKTHEGPEDNQPTIYVVRNVFSAIVSYWHYIRDFTDEKLSMEDIITGAGGPFPSWGSHLDLWNVLNRPKTIVVRYEDLVSRPDIEIQRISTFLGFAPLKPWKNNFNELKRSEPRFFRSGRKELRKGELSLDQQQLIRLFHGDWIQELKYGEPTSFSGIAHCGLLRKSISKPPSLAKQVESKTETLEQWAHAAEQRCEIEKKRADESVKWAEEAEARAAAAAKLAAENQKWAQKSDREITRLGANISELEKWGRKSDREVAKLNADLRELQQWAQKLDQLWRSEKRRADESTAWAKDAEVRALRAAKIAEETEAWAKKSDNRILKLNTHIAELKSWAETAEARWLSEKKRADENNVWAKEAEQRAMQLKRLAAENERWATSSDAKLAQLSKTCGELKKWAEDAELRFNNEKKRANEMVRLAAESTKAEVEKMSNSRSQ